MNDSLKARLDGLAVLPTLPSVAMRALELCQRENLDPNEIAALVGNDPALAARVLKTANSPAFAWRDEVRTLSRAVALLGVHAVRTLILSFSLLRDAPSTELAAMTSYWKRSVLAALAAREIASEIGYSLREEAFLAGLLQDFGILALRQLGESAYNDLLESAAHDHDRITAGERSIFGCDHAAVGAWLVARWRLPDCFRVALQHSHAVESAREQSESDDEIRTLVRTTVLSGLVADIWVRPDATGATQRAHIHARKIFPRQPTALENVVRRMATAITETAGLFQLDLGIAASVNQVAHEAQEALAIMNVAESGSPPITRGQRAAAPDPGDDLDPETRLPGLPFAEQYLRDCIGRALQAGTPMGVIVAEIDGWRELSERMLPDQGTVLLQEIARRLSSRLRRSDIVVRQRDGRFMFVLPETSREGVVVVAERTRKLILAEAYDIGAGWSPRITMSFGCTSFEASQLGHWHAIPTLAAQALEAAQAAAGNTVSVFDPPPVQSDAA
jgi:diguanylate cyclase (GGDEF)-like protein